MTITLYLTAMKDCLRSMSQRLVKVLYSPQTTKVRIPFNIDIENKSKAVIILDQFDCLPVGSKQQDKYRIKTRVPCSANTFYNAVAT